MHELIASIFGKRVIRHLDSNDYASWAGEMLTVGFDSPSLRILAGLNTFDSTHQAEDYFRRTITELKVEIPSREESLRQYACNVAKQIINRTVVPVDGVRELYAACVASDYAKEYTIWLQLDDARESLRWNETPYSYPEITRENFYEIIEKEALEFIESLCRSRRTSTT